MIVKSLLSKLSTRVFEYQGKVYTSFTPAMQGDPDEYQIYRSMSCDVEGYILYLTTTDPAYGNERDYIINTLAQLMYNNPHIETYNELLDIFKIWILSWRGNEELRWDCMKDFIFDYEEAIMENPLPYIIKFRDKSHWYPLRIELITDHLKRRQAKKRIRDEAFGASIQEDIRVESAHFRNTFWAIKPTAKYLSTLVEKSVSTVKKYGDGYYAPQKEVTAAFIALFRDAYPALSQSKLRERMEEEAGIVFSIGTIKNYWNGIDPPPAIAVGQAVTNQ